MGSRWLRCTGIGWYGRIGRRARCGIGWQGRMGGGIGRRICIRRRVCVGRLWCIGWRWGVGRCGGEERGYSVDVSPCGLNVEALRINIDVLLVIRHCLIPPLQSTVGLGPVEISGRITVLLVKLDGQRLIN